MGYTKYAYQVKPLGKEAYYPRADDPTKIVVKAYKDAITASHVWRVVKDHYTTNEKARPTIVSYWGVNRTVHGAAVITAEQAENIPQRSNEEDLDFLVKLDAEWKDKWTHENTTNRIKTLLAMLGDLEVYEDEVSYWAWNRTKNKTIFKVKGQTLILLGET